MYYEIFAIVFAVTAVVLAYAIYRIMIRMFKADSIQTFVFALLMLIIAEFMIIFLFVLSMFKVTGVA